MILTLANNWKDWEDICQYLNRFDLTGHDQFYRDGRCRRAYWMWVEQLISVSIQSADNGTRTILAYLLGTRQ